MTLSLPEIRGNPVARHPITAFVVLAFGISWLPSIVHGLLKGPETPGGVWQWVLEIARFGPSLAGVILTAVCGGFAGLRDLLGRALPWSLNIRWMLGVILIFPFIHLVGAAIDAMPPGTPAALFSAPRQTTAEWVTSVLLLSLYAGLAEELGWRGWLQPRLAGRLGDLPTCLLVSLVWAGWHVPIVFDQFSLSAPLAGAGSALRLVGTFLVTTTPVCMIFLWIYRATGGSLFAMILLHAAYDSCLCIQPEFLTRPDDVFFSGFHVALWTAGLLALTAAAYSRDDRDDTVPRQNPTDSRG